MVCFRNVSRTYRLRSGGELLAVSDLTFDVRKNEVLGLLGPNGAGKTTLLKMLTTLLYPTGGTILVDGLDVQKHGREVRARIGWVPADRRALYWKLTGEENLKFLGAMYGVPRSILRTRIPELLKLVDLWDARAELVETYSGGMMQRLLLAAALLHDPPVLVLDEPTAGLNVMGRLQFQSLIRELKERTIIYATHDVHEAQVLCDRVAILHKGRLVAHDQPSRLIEQLGGRCVEVGLRDPADAHAAEVLGDLASLGCRVVRVQGTEVVRIVFPQEHRISVQIHERFELIRDHVTRVIDRDSTLEDVFVSLVGEPFGERS